MSKWKFEKSINNIYKNCDMDTIDNKFFSCFSLEDTSNDTNNNLYFGDDMDKNFRKASVVHKIVRNEIRKKLIHDTKIKDLVEYTENRIISLLGYDRNTYFKQKNPSGIAFPVGVSINDTIAHNSALLKDDRKIEEGDVVKFDFGVHVEGCIIDSAFTHIVGAKEDDPYNELLNASKDATYSAIAMSGPDTRLYELSEVIEEIIKSYEVQVDYGIGTLDIVPVKGIGGHNILPYKIHGGKLILSVPDEEIQGNLKMESGEIYAIETYATTGSGVMTQEKDLDLCSHYMVNSECKSKQFLKKNTAYKSVMCRNGLPFTLSWCDRSHKKYSKDLANALTMGDITAYPVLKDSDPNSHVSQFEHTIRIRDSCVEIYSLGDDY
jgi:methionyl aminopeptidase